ncbi:MAG: hypothetical protein HY402_06660 [Elusimicrobia bacterium]|nr:hypothetical protein [Elusimicrobiota bacterium]
MSAPAEKPAIYKVRVSRILQETPSVRTFRLAFPAGTDFSFIPGQFVMLHFPDDPKLARSYSIASSPLQKGYLDVALNEVGRFTKRLFQLRGGEELIARGPLGKFIYKEDIPHAVTISGGTGSTPFMSFLRYVADRGLPNRVTFLYSAKTPDEIIYRSELEELSRRPNFRIYFTITRPREMPPGESWSGPTGRINMDVIRGQVPDFSEAVYFFCGPGALIHDLSAALSANHVRKENIRFEKWGDY